MVCYNYIDMKTKLKNISDVKVELTISLGAEELKAAEQVALTKLAKEVKIEGFRKGKAPLEMVAAQVDPILLNQETLENALSKCYTIKYRDCIYTYSELRILGGLGCLKFRS